MRYLSTWPRKSTSANIWRDFNDLFEDMNRSLSLVPRGEADFSYIPALDVKETDSQYEAHLDLPGMSKDEIKIEVRDNTLFISGERKHEEKHEGDFVSYERVFGRFERSVQLPKDIESEGVTAAYENGVLTVRVPKSKSSKARFVTIK